MSSLRDRLRSGRGRLKHVKTRVRWEDGTVVEEGGEGGGGVVVAEGQLGFVADTEPDLQVDKIEKNRFRT